MAVCGVSASVPPCPTSLGPVPMHEFSVQRKALVAAPVDPQPQSMACSVVTFRLQCITGVQSQLPVLSWLIKAPACGCSPQAILLSIACVQQIVHAAHVMHRLLSQAMCGLLFDLFYFPYAWLLLVAW